MTPSRKGLYCFCKDCKFKIKDIKDTRNTNLKYPCSKSHKLVRGDVMYERDFKECLLHEKEI